MKSGRLSKAEIDYILENAKQGVTKISKKLDRNPEAVKKILDDIVKKETTNIDVTNLYGKSKTAVIMTQALSETMDDVVKKAPKSSRFDSTCIIKIKP